jgi:hypothetical protein
MAGSPLDLGWWKQNAPDSIATGEIQKALADLGKLKASMGKDLNPTAYLKGLEKLVKNALPKDEQTAKKGKDKDSGKVLAQIKSAAEEQLKSVEQNAVMLVSTKSSGSAPSGKAGIAVPTVEVAENRLQANAKASNGAPAGASVSVDEIVNLGKAAWEIVKENRPSATAKSSFCQAMPSKKQLSWEQLAGWKTHSADWECAWITKLADIFGGGPNIVVKLHLEFDWNGQSSKAAGLFLNNYTAWCRSVDVPWGWDVDVDATTQGNPKNIGTEKKPIGAIQLRVAVQAKSHLQVSAEQWGITCGGDGSLRVS